MSSNAQMPCINIPPLVIPKVTLPIGAELRAVADFSKGPPSDCTLLHNLLVQLMPALAGLTCIIKILNVIASLEGALTGLLKLDVSKIVDVLKAIDDMKDCLSLVFPGIGLFEMIKDILLLVISYLKCFVDAIKSILHFQVGIDLNAAHGNPALLASLQCANDNAQTSMQQLLQALGPIEPLFNMLQPLIKISQLPIVLPSISDLAGAKDISQAVDQLDAILGTLQQIVQQIP